MFGGFNLFADPLRPFSAQYRCYSVSMLPGQERTDVDKGGKIIMPPSVLDQLTRLNVVYPMLFKLTNLRVNRITHCGVLEFVADEGKVFLPYWMMRNLLLDEGALLTVESVTLPVASYSKFQPQSTEFLDITNPKAVLENALRNFACLTTGDVFAITYNQKMYEFCVLKTEPGNAVTIIECDMNVEFAPPVGYQEPSRTAGSSGQDGDPAYDDDDDANDVDGDVSAMSEASQDVSGGSGATAAGFQPFQGTGVRLDGKSRNLESTRSASSGEVKERGVPDYNYQIGCIRFMRRANRKHEEQVTDGASSSKLSPFSGEGRQLKPPKQNRGV